MDSVQDPVSQHKQASRVPTFGSPNLSTHGMATFYKVAQQINQQT